MWQRMGAVLAALAVAALLWALPVAAQDSGDAGYEPPPQPTFFETDFPSDPPPEEPSDPPPTVPPGPPPPDDPVPPPDDPAPPPDDGELPATGLELTNGMAAAGAFLLGGIGLVLAARRRKS